MTDVELTGADHTLLILDFWKEVLGVALTLLLVVLSSCYRGDAEGTHKTLGEPNTATANDAPDTLRAVENLTDLFRAQYETVAFLKTATGTKLHFGADCTALRGADAEAVILGVKAATALETTGVYCSKCCNTAAD